MKKTLITLILFLTCSVGLFAKPSFLLVADIEAPVVVTEYGGDSSPQIHAFGIPMIGADFQIPAASPLKMYAGFRTFPALIAVVLEADIKAGYAFEKPESWKNHHIELLGNFAAGAQLGFLDGFSALPVCDLGFQVFWMSEEKGWFWGLGPNLRLLLNYYNHDHFELNTDFSLKLSAGYKF